MYGFRLLSCLYRLRKNQNRLTFKNDTPKLLSLPIFDHRTFEFTLPGGKISSVNLDVAMGTITLVLIPALSPTIRFHLILKSSRHHIIALYFLTKSREILYVHCVTLYYAQQEISWKPRKMSTLRPFHSTIQIWTYFHENEAKKNKSKFVWQNVWVEILTFSLVSRKFLAMRNKTLYSVAEKFEHTKRVCCGNQQKCSKIGKSVDILDRYCIEYECHW